MSHRSTKPAKTGPTKPTKPLDPLRPPPELLPTLLSARALLMARARVVRAAAWNETSIPSRRARLTELADSINEVADSLGQLPIVAVFEAPEAIR